MRKVVKEFRNEVKTNEKAVKQVNNKKTVNKNIGKRTEVTNKKINKRVSQKIKVQEILNIPVIKNNLNSNMSSRTDRKPKIDVSFGQEFEKIDPKMNDRNEVQENVDKVDNNLDSNVSPSFEKSLVINGNSELHSNEDLGIYWYSAKHFLNFEFIFFSNLSIDPEINAIQKNLTKEQIETVINSLDTISDQNLITATTSENPALNLLVEESTQQLDTNKTSKIKPKRKTKI